MLRSTVNKTDPAVSLEPDRGALQRQARVSWLRERPTLLSRLPDADQRDVNPDEAAALEAAVREMTFWQLYPETLGPDLVRAAIRLLVSELRA